MARAQSFQEYTVEKGDTLQKISKKFYDSYSKWPGIYEANKDVIADPNNIKPGIVLQIPMGQMKGTENFK
jgi:nucleoid-associated protein YgaU